MASGGIRRGGDVLGEQGLALMKLTSYLPPAQLADLKVADDLRVTGMDNVYRSTGLGVPVVAHRLAGPTGSDGSP